jgi:histidinol-phosphatase (PHP family)
MHSVDTLGFSDHTPLPDGRWSGVRMSLDELDDYTQRINDARKTFGDRLRTLKGMECDWVPEFEEFYRDELLGKRSYDYLIGAVHWYPYRDEWPSAFEIRTPDQLEAYTEHLIDAIASRLFPFVAHPDVFGSRYQWDETAERCSRRIATAAIEHKVLLEINGNGFRKAEVPCGSGTRRPYPLPQFWSIMAECGVPVICNSDAHHPQEVVEGIAEGIKVAQGFGLKIANRLCPCGRPTGPTGPTGRLQIMNDAN